MKSCLTVFALILTITLQAQDKPEVLYHIAQKSFFDSDGDGLTDPRGIQQKLTYLEQLGVNAIVLEPVYETNIQGYSNNDFMTVNPKLGLLADYRNVVVEAHKKVMKVYQVVNLQYVGTGHEWFKKSFKKPASEHSRLIYYADNKNEKPIYLKETNVAVNLAEPKVQEYMIGMLKQWADPNKDKLFNDGVDGFVLDMTDKITGAPKLVNLYKGFWKPLAEAMQAYNPKLKIMAQQDMESLIKGGADRVFSAKLESALGSTDKKTIGAVADSIFKQLPEGKQVLVTVPGNDSAGKQKISAALNVFAGGVPVIQSGRETGAKDAAMDWKIAEEQTKDPNSLWSFYRQLIKTCKTDPGLSNGRYKEIVNSSNDVVSFTRTYKNFTTLVMINLSDTERPVVIGEPELRLSAAKVIFGTTAIIFPPGGRAVTLPAYGVQAWRIVTGPSR